MRALHVFAALACFGTCSWSGGAASLRGTRLQRSSTPQSRWELDSESAVARGVLQLRAKGAARLRGGGYHDLVGHHDLPEPDVNLIPPRYPPPPELFREANRDQEGEAAVAAAEAALVEERFDEARRLHQVDQPHISWSLLVQCSRILRTKQSRSEFLKGSLQVAARRFTEKWVVSQYVGQLDDLENRIDATEVVATPHAFCSATQVPPSKCVCILCGRHRNKPPNFQGASHGAHAHVLPASLQEALRLAAELALIPPVVEQPLPFWSISQHLNLTEPQVQALEGWIGRCRRLCSESCT